METAASIDPNPKRAGRVWSIWKISKYKTIQSRNNWILQCTNFSPTLSWTSFFLRITVQFVSCLSMLQLQLQMSWWTNLDKKHFICKSKLWCWLILFNFMIMCRCGPQQDSGGSVILLCRVSGWKLKFMLHLILLTSGFTLLILLEFMDGLSLVPNS